MKREEVPETNPDIGRRVLKALRGYNYRQNFIEADLAVLVSLLDQWDGQISLLEEKIVECQATIRCHTETIHVLASENDELKASRGLKGVMRWAIGSKSESQSTVTAP